MMARRFLVLHLPKLGTDRIRKAEPDLAGVPLATWDTDGNRRVLTDVDAPGTTLRVGQALADAQAMHPDLVLRPADPAEDAAFLERLALWALRFTPLAAVDPPNGLVLDVTGATHLFGGEAALVQRVCAGLAHSGITGRVVMASIAEAAAALARAGRSSLVLAPGAETAAVAALPLGVLRLPETCLSGLRRLGLDRVGDLLRQPRAPLGRRFGRTLLDVLDALNGNRPRVLSPVRQPPAFVEAVTFLEPITTRPAIDHAVDTLLEALCRTLVDAGQGARQMTLRAFRVDHDVQEITIGTGLPTRVPAHLRRLFDNELERLEPDLGFERIALQADVTNPMMAAQSVMVTTGTDAAQTQEALGQLIDRLSQRLPVWRLAPGDSHWPERSVVTVGPFDPVSTVAGRSGLPAPVRVLKRPLPIVVREGCPDGPPAALRIDGTVQPVGWWEGPDRIEPEWWQADTEARPGRDYYRVELASGARLWIGRASQSPSRGRARWFLHGYLA